MTEKECYWARLECVGIFNALVPVAFTIFFLGMVDSLILEAIDSLILEAFSGK